MGHVCQCQRCTPDAFPPESYFFDRAGEGHVAVRFGDHTGPTDVYVDGVKHTRVVEAMAGRDGWAIVADEPTHHCSCGSFPCLRVERGHVTLDLGGEP